MTDDDPTGSDDEPSVHVGVDIGGTFTDLIALEPSSGAIHTAKVPSTPRMPADGVMHGLETLLEATGYGPADVTTLAHGSTVTVNALIEGAGATTGVVLTDGFDAILVAGSGSRPQADVKNPRYGPPEPLVPQRRVYGVPERIDATGGVVEALDEATTREAIAELREDGVESIAVCFLFSFLDSEHERRVASLIREEHPDCWISVSSTVAPRIREYPRFATTLVDAYVGPLLDRYLTRLKRTLLERGIDPDDLSMMFSHGGLEAFDNATSRPVYTLLSGPTAGVQGALFAADLVGAADVITMDMGGTSCDIAIAPGGEPITTTERAVAGYPVSVPMVDVQAVGAGGGTIARVQAGRLTVGPDSAGADPGPVCYGRGGTNVTVTDANAFLGRLDTASMLGGDLGTAADTTEAVLVDQIADPLDLTAVEAAAGIIEVVNDKMKKELSVALTEHGCDPRSFSLVTYGGAGPMHAVAIARELSIQQVIVPPWPGLNSAVGLLTTDRKRIYERSRVDSLVDVSLSDRFAVLESEARSANNHPDVRYDRELDLRYDGQSYELTVPVEPDDTPSSLRDKFTEIHRERFGHVSDESLETMTYRVISIVERDLIAGEMLSSDGPITDFEPASFRPVYFGGSFTETPVFDREELPDGVLFDGPAIVEQMDTTLVVEPEVSASVDDHGNLVLVDRTGGANDD